MALGFAMPEFADGTPLSATELNKISTAQRYARRMQMINYGFLEINEVMTTHVLHRYRYLHWSANGDLDATLYVNDQSQGLKIGNNLSGIVDLNTVTGLTVGLPYSVRWSGNGAFGRYFIEHPDTQLNSIDYPEPISQFGTPGTVPAILLNRLSRNTQHLLSDFVAPPSGGFSRVTCDFDAFPDRQTALRTWHVQKNYRYLLVHFEHQVQGDEHPRGSRIYVNGQICFEGSIPSAYQGLKKYTICIDLEGGNSEVFEIGAGVGVNVLTDPTTAPTLGQWYPVAVRCSANLPSGIGDVMRVNLVAETPDKVYL